MTLSYCARADTTTNSIAKKLFSLMEDKQTNLCVAADVITKSELLRIAELTGPFICCLKTHIDIVEDYDEDLIIEIQRLAEKHSFVIFEDRKFADIGNTVQMQYRDGIYHIADWAHITNAHTVPGPGVIEGLKEVGLHKERGLLLLAQMSPKGNLATEDYTKQSIAMAKEHRDFVIGFIGRGLTPDEPGFINFMPGVKLSKGEDALKQQYETPESTIAAGVDVIIVGRGITEARDPVAAAKEYRQAGWAGYQQRILVTS